MIKDALQYIVGLKKPEAIKIGDRVFRDKDYFPVTEPEQNSISVNTLGGIVDLVKKDFNNQPCYILCDSPNSIRVVTEVFGVEKQRTKLYSAEAMLPSQQFDRSMSMERFIVWLQSGFIQDENRDMLLKVASSIQFNDSTSIVDDGISQTATAKTGVAKLENIKLPSPIKLRPYRTFLEVEQPASDFVFRIDKMSGFALYEADGGAWKNEAIGNIKEYFVEQFETKPNVVVIA